MRLVAAALHSGHDRIDSGVEWRGQNRKDGTAGGRARYATHGANFVFVDDDDDDDVYYYNC